MAHISLQLLADFKPSSVIRNVLAITSSPDNVSHSLQKIFHSCKVVEPEWLKSAIATLKPLPETANTIDFLLPSSQDGEPFVKFVVAVLPTACSRHNTPSNSHIVNSVVKANKGTGNLVVLVTPKNDDFAFAQACSVGRNFPTFTMKNGKTSNDSHQVDIVLDLAATTENAHATLLNSIEDNIKNIRLAQRLVDMPPNLLHVDSYIEEAKQVATELGCHIKIIQGTELELGGFGGLWGVGKASEHPPALVILSFNPSGAHDAAPTTGDVATSSICLVGKGIVYDTGGLSIKTPTTSMAGMKMDMGGSAAVLGSFAASVRGHITGHTLLTKPLHALLCIAENSVDERSIRPDDVITMLSGKTVEVNNTDAEGRLVLGDGVHYASKQLNPSTIIDIATLTGAQLIATGKNHAALYCNDDALEALAVQVGKQTGDLTHPLPYCPEFYKNEFKSQVM